VIFTIRLSKFSRQMPGGGPQSAVDGEDEARELPARRHPTVGGRHPAEARCRAEARRVQSMVKMKPASSPRAATRHPAEARLRCRAEARRVQSMVKMKPASSPRAATRHPDGGAGRAAQAPSPPLGSWSASTTAFAG
jgi:hypothetical protein